MLKNFVIVILLLSTITSAYDVLSTINGEKYQGTIQNFDELKNGLETEVVFESLDKNVKNVSLDEVQFLNYKNVRYNIKFERVITRDIDTTKTIYSVKKSDLKKGIYRNANEFLLNAARDYKYPLKIDDNSEIEFNSQTVNSYGSCFNLYYSKDGYLNKCNPVENGFIWGYCDGEQVFVKHNNSYIPLYFDKSDVWSIGAGPTQTTSGHMGGFTAFGNTNTFTTTVSGGETTILLLDNKFKVKTSNEFMTRKIFERSPMVPLSVDELKYRLSEFPVLHNEYKNLSSRKQKKRLIEFYISYINEKRKDYSSMESETTLYTYKPIELEERKTTPKKTTRTEEIPIPGKHF